MSEQEPPPLRRADAARRVRHARFVAVVGIVVALLLGGVLGSVLASARADGVPASVPPSASEPPATPSPDPSAPKPVSLAEPACRQTLELASESVAFGGELLTQRDAQADVMAELNTGTLARDDAVVRWEQVLADSQAAAAEFARARDAYLESLERCLAVAS